MLQTADDTHLGTKKNSKNNVGNNIPSASKPLGYNEVSMPVSGIKTNMGGVKPKDCNIEKMINPSELLPLNNVILLDSKYYLEKGYLIEIRNNFD